MEFLSILNTGAFIMAVNEDDITPTEKGMYRQLGESTDHPTPKSAPFPLLSDGEVCFYRGIFDHDEFHMFGAFDLERVILLSLGESGVSVDLAAVNWVDIFTVVTSANGERFFLRPQLADIVSGDEEMLLYEMRGKNEPLSQNHALFGISEKEWPDDLPPFIESEWQAALKKSQFCSRIGLGGHGIFIGLAVQL